MRQQVMLAILGLPLVGACSKADREARQDAAKGAANLLLNPRAQEMQITAPATYRARFETSAGSFTIEVTRDWAPRGADRFYNLVSHGFFDGTRFFRVVPGFIVQFGLSGNPAISASWRDATIPDDPVKQHNTRGTLSFATGGPGTRTTQMFINFVDNSRLDGMGFAPLGVVVEGMDVVDRIHAEYGEAPDQGMIQSQGNAYLAGSFPRLDTIARATIVTP